MLARIYIHFQIICVIGIVLYGMITVPWKLPKVDDMSGSGVYEESITVIPSPYGMIDSFSTELPILKVADYFLILIVVIVATIVLVARRHRRMKRRREFLYKYGASHWINAST